jgi:DNA-binding MarR family transcriptional regulator
LWEKDGLPTSSIGDKLQQVGGTLTGVLDRMEERGLIRRERDSKDRRIWRIWLTESGKKLESTIPAIVTELREETWSGVSHQERELFSQILNRAIANLSP